MTPRELSTIVHSHAKVNLSLDILGKRPDGYHDLESVMQTVSLSDTIELSVQREPGIRIECSAPYIPADSRNLAWKAAELLFESRKISTGVRIRIEKRIPTRAGLGGGSSNAASVLNGLNDLLDLSMSTEELCDIAATIGSDVPFFLIGGIALVQGRGEVVSPLQDIRPWSLLIVKPPFGVSTPWAYKRLDEMRSAESVVEKPETYSRRLCVCIERDGCEQLPELLGNDLEAPAMESHPEIAEIKRDLLSAGAKGSLMCGSGSAVFGLFESETEARSAMPRLAGYGEVFVAKTLARG